MIDKVVENIVLFCLESIFGGNDFPDFAFGYFLVPNLESLLGSILGQFLALEDASQFAHQRISLLELRSQFKQQACFCLLLFTPFLSTLGKNVSGTGEQLHFGVTR